MEYAFTHPYRMINFRKCSQRNTTYRIASPNASAESFSFKACEIAFLTIFPPFFFFFLLVFVLVFIFCFEGDVSPPRRDPNNNRFEIVDEEDDDEAGRETILDACLLVVQAFVPIIVRDKTIINNRRDFLKYDRMVGKFFRVTIL